MTALVVVLLSVGVAGLVSYGRWAGWGFGLGWWGRPTPAQVLSVQPLKGALMQGGAPWAMKMVRQRCQARLEVQPAGGAPYDATAIVWAEPTATMAGPEITARVSRTRPRRVLVPRGRGTGPPPVDPTAGRY